MRELLLLCCSVFIDKTTLRTAKGQSQVSALQSCVRTCIIESQTLYEVWHFLGQEYQRRRNCTKLCVSSGPRKLSMIEICPYYRERDNCMKFCFSGTQKTVHHRDVHVLKELYVIKVTRPSFLGGVSSYFEALWYPHLYFYRKSNTQNG